MKKIKVTYILANIDKAIAFEWIANHLNRDKFELSFIFMHNKEPFLYNWLKEKNIACFFIKHNGKKSYPLTFIKTLKLLSSIKPSVVHTHLFDANLIGLSAAKLLRIKKRIYTRHHSTFHHEYYPKAVKWDNLANKLATGIVAISENVKQVLLNQEKVIPEKIQLIYHGFDIEGFRNIDSAIVDELKTKYDLHQNTPIIGVVSRFINWKGIQYIIPAFKQLLNQYPHAKLVLANATGPNKAKIINLLQQELNPQHYRTIVFEPNLFALYQLFDVYVHVPINAKIEAFGQTYIEALAAGIPSIFTLSGVANEFIENNKNAIVVDYKNSEEIRTAITTLLTDEKLKNKLVENGKQSIKPFNLNLFIQKLERLYE